MRPRHSLTLSPILPIQLSKVGRWIGVLEFKATFAVADLNSFGRYLGSGGSDDLQLSIIGRKRKSEFILPREVGTEFTTEEMQRAVDLLNLRLDELQFRIVHNVDRNGTR
jgi:hypothetical protein